MVDRKSAEILWDYHHLNQEITPGDSIIAFGSHDLHVAERAAELYLQGYGKFIIFTGGLGRVTEKIWRKPEAVKFAETAFAAGVPEEAVFIEPQSRNTGENISFTRRLLQEKNLKTGKAAAVDKPFKERRLYATLKKQWPELCFSVTSPQNSFDEYLEYYRNSGELGVDDFINIMVGDLQRIDVYGQNGFQIPQEIPEEVREAYRALVRAGYDKQLLPGG